MLSIPYFTCGYASAYPAYPAAPPIPDCAVGGRVNISFSKMAGVLKILYHKITD